MKRLFLLMFTILFCTFAKAETWTDENGTIWQFSYDPSNGTAVIYGSWDISLQKGTPCVSGIIPSNLTIPSKLKVADVEYDVTSIGADAFDGCSSLTSITIPEGVTSIEYRAFYKCSSLTSITIPEGVTSINNRTFSGCSSLTSITIPEGVTSIEGYAFSGCSSLTSITIPEGVTNIESYVFSGCSSLTSFTIPEWVTSIGNYVFQNCSSLTTINIPKWSTVIGSYAFSGVGGCFYCEDTTPCSISNDAFDMRSIIFVPNNAVEAYRTAWTNYNDIIVGNSHANLVEVTLEALPSSSALAAEIGEANLGDVVKLKVSGTINSYDMMIIRNKMTRLRELDLEDASIVANNYEYYQGYHSEDNVLGGSFLRDTKIKSVVLPTTATSIGENAFVNCSNLCSVSNLDGITSIGSQAFFNCSNLTSIALPNSLTTLGNSAFWGCI